MSTTQNEDSTESPDLIHRIASLTRMLRDSMRELGLDQAIKDAANAIPDARDRLRYVAQMTEQAANRVLNATEQAGPLQDKLENVRFFFDRGVPDVIGYLMLCNLPVPQHMEEAARQTRYNRTVFLAPPWEEIFGQDTERKQDFEEAIRTFEAMDKTYRRLGYEIALLPKSSVEERVSFIKQTLPSVFL